MIAWRLIKWALRLIVILVALIVFAGLILQATNPKPKEREAWALGPQLPLERGEVASTVVDGELIVIGGLRGLKTVSDDVSILDTASGRWVDAGTLPGLHHAAAAAIGKTVFVSGGARSVTNWTPSDDLYGFTPRSKSPAGATKMPEGRQGHAMVAIGKKLYIVGGVGPSARTLICDTAKGKWTFGAPLPHPRDHLRAVVYKDEIWAIGGRSGSPTNRVDIYDPKTDDWRTGPPLPKPMSAMAVGVVGKQIHVVGGENPGPVRGGVIHEHYAYDGRIWEDEEQPALAVHGAGYGVVGGRLLVAGGASRQGMFSVLSWTSLVQIFTA